MNFSSVKVALVAGVFAFSSTVSARSETLADALVSAYQNSGLLEQNRALLRAADEGVAGAVSRLRPVLNYAIGGAYSSVTNNTSGNLELSASMMLYDFGATQLSIDAAKENVLALREALVSVEQNVLLEAVQAYLDVRRDISIVALRQNNMRLITQELQASQDRFDVGEVTRTDVANAQARLASAQSSLAVAQGNLAVSREAYNVAVGRYPGTLAEPPFPRQLAKSVGEARSVARQRHPLLLQAKRDVTLSEINIAIAQAAMKPSLVATARGSVDYNKNDNSSVGLSLAGPIYQGGFLQSQRRRAAALRDSSLANLHLVSLSIDQNVANAWALLKVAEAAQKASIEQISAARVAFEGTREEARFGARTTLDVLDAEQELLDAESTKIEADTQRYNAVYSLLSTMGLLTVDELRLGITTYDPAAYYNAVRNAPTYNVSPEGKKLDRVLRSIGKQ